MASAGCMFDRRGALIADHQRIADKLKHADFRKIDIFIRRYYIDNRSISSLAQMFRQG